MTEKHTSDNIFETEDHSHDESELGPNGTMPPGTVNEGRPFGGGMPNRRFKTGDEILGRYVVKEELGQGGMGVVYKCFDEIGRTEVAVKSLPPEVSHNPAEMEDVRDNYTLVTKLAHPNIASCKTLERDRDTGDYYLVMDYVDGESLRQWMRRQRRERKLSLEMALPILRQIAEALDTAHRQGVIHRDVKPDNVKIAVDGTVKVLDFGLAAQIRSSMAHISNETVARAGTNLYKSPEQWLASTRQGEATDQYSLAVTAYEMLSGRVPFDSDDMSMLKDAVLTRAPELIEGLPSHANAALMSGLAKDPKKRYANCVDFVRALGGEKVKPCGGAPNQNSRLWFAAAVAVLLAAGGVVYFMQRSDEPKDSIVVHDGSDGKASEEDARALAETKAAAEKKAADEALKEAGKMERERKAAEAARMAEQQRKAEEEARKKDAWTNSDRIFSVNGVTLTLKPVRRGRFQMGSPESADGRFKDETQHWVTLTEDFYIGETEVTQAQWKAVMGTTLLEQANKQFPGKGQNYIWGQGDNYPMYFVNWEEADEFCQKLTDIERRDGRLSEKWKFTLPTEAQWEYAARGGDKSKGYRKYSGGDTLDWVGWYFENSGQSRLHDKDWNPDNLEETLKNNRCATHPVGMKSSNELGLCDMSGNVWEWCRDSCEYNNGVITNTYKDGVTDPLCSTGSLRVFRGGSWSGPAAGCRSACRIGDAPSSRDDGLGFRVALVPVQ